jgi:uncharacterized protein (UPF0305 family)
VQPLFQIINTTCRNALNMINELLKRVYWETQQTVKKKARLDLVRIAEDQLNAYRLLQKEDKQFQLISAAEAVYIKTDPVRPMLST